MDIIASSMLANILTEWVGPIFLFIFGLGAVVFVHELGHFVVAKMCGITVERFALGFGPRLFGIKIGQTDYAIMLLPLGGYVKMVGQEDFAPNEDTKDPGAFCNKSVGARFAVISAGVIMNVIFAALLLVALGMYGMRFQAPIIGSISERSPSNNSVITWQDDQQPSSTVGLEPGDKVLTIESDTLLSKCLGSDITKFSKITMLGVLSDVDDKYKFTVERKLNGETRTGTADVGLYMAPSMSGSGAMMPQFGLTAASSLEIAGMDKDLLFGEDGFEANDVIKAVNGTPVKASWMLESAIKDLRGAQTTLVVDRAGEDVKVSSPTAVVRGDDIYWLKDGSVVRGSFESVDTEKSTLTFIMKDGSKKTVADDQLASDSFIVLGMVPRLGVMGIFKKSPADKAGLQAGDVITAYGDNANPTISKIHELNKKFIKQPTQLKITRDGKTETLTITPKKRKDSAQIGMLTTVDYNNLVLADVYENSVAQKAGFIPGDAIEKINGEAIKTWPELIAKLSALNGKKVTFTVRRGTATKQLAIDKMSDKDFQLNDYQTALFRTPRGLKPLMTPRVSRGPIAALGWGVRETFTFLATQYATFRSLFAGTVSTKELTGPVGIGNMAIQAGRKGITEFAYFMAMISVALAVVNFLPIPVVDGGHALFLIIEKIIGKPLPLKVMNAIQMVGLAFIGLLFIAITWQDILRIISRAW